MLFSMLQIASLFDVREGREASSSTPNLYLLRAGQALVTGQYHRARPCSVEALLLYAFCKWMCKEDQEKDAWMIMGVCVRLAMRMGYHRDPRHLTSITPFEGEMRRRTFFLVEIFDLLFAFQAGLPAIVQEEECDVEPPRNLFDTDFSEDCKELPPSRPPGDPTPMLYFCYKCRMAKILRRVIRHALSLKESRYEDTMRLDGELQETHEDVPPSLRMRPLSSSFIEPAITTSQRLTINLMYLKSLCVLHRSFLGHDRSNPTYHYSRTTCVDAALQILTHQAELYTACQPGGLFHDDQWMLSNLVLRDSLLAAMILCLDLYEARGDLIPIDEEIRERNARRYSTLEACHRIWLCRRTSSREAARASKVLGFMLSKLSGPTAVSPSPNLSLGISVMSQNDAGGNIINSIATSSSVSPCHIIEQTVPQRDHSQNDVTLLDHTAGDPLHAIFNDSNEPDWVSPDKDLLVEIKG
jgi:hypothetical protein